MCAHLGFFSLIPAPVSKKSKLATKPDTISMLGCKKTEKSWHLRKFQKRNPSQLELRRVITHLNSSWDGLGFQDLEPCPFFCVFCHRCWAQRASPADLRDGRETVPSSMRNSWNYTQNRSFNVRTRFEGNSAHSRGLGARKPIIIPKSMRYKLRAHCVLEFLAKHRFSASAGI